MIYFVIRVLVNALALAVTIILLPGLTVGAMIPGVIDISATFLIYGIMIGLINSFVRPFVLLFTARLLVRSMGLFVFVLNAFFFWLLSLFAPASFVVNDPFLFWILLGGVLMALGVIVMEALFGLDSPDLGGGIESQFYWRWVGYLSTGRRNLIAENLRVVQILGILERYTKDIAVEMTPFARFRVFMQELIFRGVDPIHEMEMPEKIRHMLQEMGTTFVKFGQIVSSRAEQLPPEWEAELELLQSNVPPFPYESARAILINELGDTPEALFGSFEQEPFAAASTAQVHKATLLDGTAVVVKIQRPNIDITVKADLNVMNDLAKRIQKRQDWARAIDLRGLVKEFGEGILDELDYRNEASNIGLLTRNMAQFDFVRIPAVYSGLSSSKVLTMDFVSGVKISNVDAIDEAGIDKGLLARNFVHAMVKQVLFDGFFHADPHPGNVLVDLNTAQVDFLDMGLMGEMNRIQRMALADLLVSMVEQDGYNMGKAALRLSKPLPGMTIDEGQFLEKMDRFGQRFLGIEDADMSYVFTALQDMLRQNGLRLDPNFTLVFKTLMQADEIIRRLEPTINLSSSAVDSSMVLMREQANTEYIGEQVRKQLSRSSREVIYRIPNLVEATTKWLDQYEKGKLSVYVDMSDLSEEVTKLDDAVGKAFDRLVIGMILAGWLVGAAIVSTVDITIDGYSLSNFAYYLFIGGALIGIYVIFTSLRRQRSHDDDDY